MANRLLSYLVDARNRAVGLDISERELRFVQLRNGKKGPDVVRFGVEPLPAKTIVDGELAQPAALELALTAFATHVGSGRYSTNAVWVSLPDRHTFVKFLPLPNPSDRENEESIRWAISQHVPYDLKELTIGWAAVDQKKSGGQSAVLAAAMPSATVQSFVTSLERANLTVLGVEPRPLAIYRVLQEKIDVESTVLVVILDDDEGLALVVHHGVPHLASTLPVSKLNQLEAIQQRYHINQSEAERARLFLGLSEQRARGIVRRALDKPFQDLADRLKQILAFHEQHAEESTPKAILLSGPGSLTYGADRYLSEAIGLPTTLLQLNTIQSGVLSTNFKARAQEFLAAFGLALISRVETTE